MIDPSEFEEPTWQILNAIPTPFLKGMGNHPVIPPKPPTYSKTQKPIAAAAKSVDLLDAWMMDLEKLQELRDLGLDRDRVDEAIFYLKEAAKALEGTSAQTVRRVKSESLNLMLESETMKRLRGL